MLDSRHDRIKEDVRVNNKDKKKKWMEEKQKLDAWLKDFSNMPADEKEEKKKDKPNLGPPPPEINDRMLDHYRSKHKKF
jgi:hypothetical protein